MMEKPLFIINFFCFFTMVFNSICLLVKVYAGEGLKALLYIVEKTELKHIFSRNELQLVPLFSRHVKYLLLIFFCTFCFHHNLYLTFFFSLQIFWLDNNLRHTWTKIWVIILENSLNNEKMAATRTICCCKSITMGL